MTNGATGLGTPTPEDLSRLGGLDAILQRFRDTMRYVDYREAQRDCELLAAKILQQLPSEELARFSFLAIPRGGLIVLGMLSYALDLHPDQLSGGPAASGPMCIVDDCALSGARFAAALAATEGSEVVFVHLYSHPELRRAILEGERRVTHCLAAHDLADHVRRSFRGEQDYLAWKQRWRRSLGPEPRFWYGQPELVCFAWTEPQSNFWSSAKERVETGWRIQPPHRCLKNRVLLTGPLRHLPGLEWRVPPAVVSADFDGVLWLCQTESEQVFSLAGTAAEMWRLVAGWGALDLAVEELVAAYAVAEDRARADLIEFISRLEAAGLLERADAAGPRGS